MSRMLNGNYLIDRYGFHAAPRDPISLAIGAQAILGSAALFTTPAAVAVFGAVGTVVVGAALAVGLSAADCCLSGAKRS